MPTNIFRKAITRHFTYSTRTLPCTLLHTSKFRYPGHSNYRKNQSSFNNRTAASMGKNVEDFFIPEVTNLNEPRPWVKRVADSSDETSVPIPRFRSTPILFGNPLCSYTMQMRRVRTRVWPASKASTTVRLRQPTTPPAPSPVRLSFARIGGEQTQPREQRGPAPHGRTFVSTFIADE